MIPNSFDISSIPFKDGVLDYENWNVTLDDVDIKEFNPSLRGTNSKLFPILKIDEVYLQIHGNTIINFNPYCQVFEDSTFDEAINVEGVKKKNKLNFQIRTSRFIIEIPSLLYFLLHKYDKTLALERLINLSNPNYKKPFYDKKIFNKNSVIKLIKEIMFDIFIYKTLGSLENINIEASNFKQVHDLDTLNDDLSQLRAWLLFRLYICDLPKSKLFENDKIIINYLFSEIKNNSELIKRMKQALKTGSNRSGKLTPEKRDTAQVQVDLWDYYKDEVHKLNFK